MKTIIVTCFCLLVVTCSARAQKEWNNWYFGDSAAVTFNTPDGIPQALNYSRLSWDFGSASVSDKAGNLLFYCNGRTIWDKNGTEIANGLYADSITSQSVLIVPKPSDSSIYYIFTVNYAFSSLSDSNTLGYFYSVYDIVQNKLIQKNTKMLDWRFVNQKITAIKHRNNEDFWVIAHTGGSISTFYVFLLTKDGLSNMPVKYDTDTVPDGYYTRGVMKPSQAGDKIALGGSSAFPPLPVIRIMDFNNLTGEVSPQSEILLPILPNSIGCLLNSVEFSPDGRLLYVCDSEDGFDNGVSFSTGILYQVDLAGSSHDIYQIDSADQRNFNPLPCGMCPNAAIAAADGAGALIGTVWSPFGSIVLGTIASMAEAEDQNNHNSVLCGWEYPESRYYQK